MSAAFGILVRYVLHLLVSINSPSGEGGELENGVEVEGDKVFPLILLQAKAVR